MMFNRYYIWLALGAGLALADIATSPAYPEDMKLYPDHSPCIVGKDGVLFCPTQGKGKIGNFTGDSTKPPTPLFDLVVIDNDGQGHVTPYLSKERCDFMRARVLGQPATPEEIAEQKRQDDEIEAEDDEFGKQRKAKFLKDNHDLRKCKGTLDIHGFHMSYPPQTVFSNSDGCLLEDPDGKCAYVIDSDGMATTAWAPGTKGMIILGAGVSSDEEKERPTDPKTAECVAH